MTHPLHAAMTTFVVEVESATAPVNPAGLLQVIAAFDRFRVPATWALESASQSRTLELLLGRLPAADIAINLAPLAQQPGQRRDWIAEEMSRRCEVLHQLGKHPSSVLVQDTQAAERLDIFVKHKIRWLIERQVRRPRPTHGATGDLQEKSARFGVWVARPSWRIPERSRWSRQWQRVGSRRKLNLAVQEARPLVALVSLEELIATAGAWSSLNDILKLAARRRSQGRLQLESLAGLTLALQPPRKGNMRSILRPAA